MTDEAAVGSEAPSSRDIPRPVKRAVRQRCAFGCVVCGLPLYEYDHLSGWRHGHHPSQITLLCDQHHKEKTNGLLPLEAVREANQHPYNRRQGVSKPYDLHYSGTDYEMVVGSNSFSTPGSGDRELVAVAIDGLPLLGFRLEDQHLLFNLRVFDENNELVLLIVENQLVYSVSPWDVELTGQTLRVRDAPNQFLLEARFDVPDKVTFTRGRFLLNGVEMLIRLDHFVLTNNSVSWRGSSFRIAGLAIAIGPMPQEVPCGIRIHRVPRYFGDRTEATNWARETLGEIKEKTEEQATSPDQSQGRLPPGALRT